MKKKILIVFGGVSSEHDVSLVSASNVIKNISKEKYDTVMMGITKDGESFVFTGNPDLLPNDKWFEQKDCLVKAIISPDRLHHGIVYLKTGAIERIDCVFPVLHGKNGEDGTIQGLLELAGIPFVGCDHTSSCVCMDKTLTNTLADYFGFLQAKWTGTNRFDYYLNPDEFINEAQDKLGYPVFVKPACAGSSVGISKAYCREELIKACEEALEYDNKILCEQTIVGREIEC
nr:D-alanine--D-alanine ligase [Clostridiales bacterium]